MLRRGVEGPVPAAEVELAVTPGMDVETMPADTLEVVFTETGGGEGEITPVPAVDVTLALVRENEPDRSPAVFENVGVDEPVPPVDSMNPLEPS